MGPKKLPSLNVSWTQKSAVDIELDNVIKEILSHAKTVPVPDGFAEFVAKQETERLLSRLMLPKE